MTYLLDTDTVSNVRAGRFPYAQRFIETNIGDVYTSDVTAAEVLKGWADYLSKARTEEHARRAYNEIVIAVDELSRFQVVRYTEVAQRILEGFSGEIRRIGLHDRRIAAIAIANDLTVVRSNLRDFGRIAEVRVLDWGLIL